MVRLIISTIMILFIFIAQSPNKDCPAQVIDGTITPYFVNDMYWTNHDYIISTKLGIIKVSENHCPEWIFEDNILDTAYSGDLLKIAMKDESNNLVIYSLTEQQILQRLPSHIENIYQAWFSSSSNLLAISNHVSSLGIDENYRLEIWDLESLSVVAEIYPQRGIRDLEFSNDDRYLSILNIDDQVWVWDIQLNQRIVYSQPYPAWNNAVDVAFSPNSTIAVATSNRAADTMEIEFREITTGDLLNTIDTRAFQLQYNPKGNLLASIDGANVRVFDLESKSQIASWQSSLRFVGLFFNPDGSQLALIDYFGENLEVWDIASSMLVFQTHLYEFNGN